MDKTRTESQKKLIKIAMGTISINICAWLIAKSIQEDFIFEHPLILLENYGHWIIFGLSIIQFISALLKKTSSKVICRVMQCIIVLFILQGAFLHVGSHVSQIEEHIRLLFRIWTAVGIFCLLIFFSKDKEYHAVNPDKREDS